MRFLHCGWLDGCIYASGARSALTFAGQSARHTHVHTHGHSNSRVARSCYARPCCGGECVHVHVVYCTVPAAAVVAIKRILSTVYACVCVLCTLWATERIAVCHTSHIFIRHAWCTQHCIAIVVHVCMCPFVALLPDIMLGLHIYCVHACECVFAERTRCGAVYKYPLLPPALSVI